MHGLLAYCFFQEDTGIAADLFPFFLQTPASQSAGLNVMAHKEDDPSSSNFSALQESLHDPSFEEPTPSIPEHPELHQLIPQRQIFIYRILLRQPSDSG
jgi:hypothetical protein